MRSKMLHTPHPPTDSGPTLTNQFERAPNSRGSVVVAQMQFYDILVPS